MNQAFYLLICLRIKKAAIDKLRRYNLPVPIVFQSAESLAHLIFLLLFYQCCSCDELVITLSKSLNK